MSTVSGVPWQGVVTAGFIATLVLASCVVGGLVSGFFGLSVLVIASQGVALVIVVLLIPVFLNLSRTFYGYLLGILLVHVGGAILQYALLYRHSGLVSAAGISHSFRDALYFSVTTWTTLGYGDFTAPPAMRLTTSAEALMGVTSLALAASYFWLFVTDQLLPSNGAILDGEKFHVQSLTWHRLRIRGLRKGVRAFEPEYIDPPPSGTVLYQDREKRRWEILPPGEEVPNNTSIIRF